MTMSMIARFGDWSRTMRIAPVPIQAVELADRLFELGEHNLAIVDQHNRK